MASKFGITADDLSKKLVPANLATANPNGFVSIGASGDLTEAEALAIIYEMEAIVLGRLDRRYQELIEECPGEILCKNAYDGQTTVTCKLTPITNGTLRVFKNIDIGRWEERNNDDALTEDDDYTVNLTTGVITFTEALVAGDRIYADYSHTAASTHLLGLRYVVITLAAVEVWRRLKFHRDDFDDAFFTDWENSAYQTLNRWKGNRVFDNVDLVYETNDDFTGILNYGL